MNQGGHKLEKKGKKGTCRHCNHTGVWRYFDGYHGDSSFGRCERVNNCPTGGKVFFPNEPAPEFVKNEVPEVAKEIIYLDEAKASPIIEQQKSLLHLYLIEGKRVSAEHLKLWNVGSEFDEKYKQSKPVFFFKNAEQKFVNRKSGWYLDNGKRDKSSDRKGFFSLPQPKDETKKYALCLFGEHLLSADKSKPVIVVESEKTALIASFHYPEFDWVSCGSSNGLTAERLQPLMGRKVWWLCDSDKAGRNNSSLKHLKQHIADCGMIDLWADKQNGWDIADSILKGMNPVLTEELVKPIDIILPPAVETAVEEEKVNPAQFIKDVMAEIGIKAEHNKVNLVWSDGLKQEFELLKKDDNGNVLFTLYSIDGELLTSSVKQTGSSIQQVPLNVVKLRQAYQDEKSKKWIHYKFPKGSKQVPLFPPNILEQFQKREQVENLIICSSYEDALCGWMNGLNCVGLPSINSYKDKDTQMLHTDLLKLIKACKVKNIILMYDGSCRNIDTEALSNNGDLRIKPASFFHSAKAIRELLKDAMKDEYFELYFAHIQSSNIEGAPINLMRLYTDLALAELKEEKANAPELLPSDAPPSETEQIVPGLKIRRKIQGKVMADLFSFSKPTNIFYKKNISHDIGALTAYLHIDNVNSFYAFHVDAWQVLKENPFLWGGTQYEYNDKTSECEVKIPGESKNYIRVGDDYFEKLNIPNKYQQLEKQLHRRKKATITDDYGKAFASHIQKLKAFCNVPDHVNYRDIVDNCYNVYAPFEHTIEEGECTHTLNFIRHIFGEQYELGLDYVQLLYQQPTQTLPILCLVSKENNTGKSTFGKWLKAVFTQNMCVVGNAELSNEFNGSYATRLLVCCEEAFIEKKVVIERIKSMATADKILMNNKGRDHVEIDFFAKFLLFSNNEENFIYASDDDIRYWVRKVPLPKTDAVDLLKLMIDEIPAFLFHINNRRMSTERKSRMWFAPSLIRTDALRKVVEFNKPMIEKEIRNGIINKFLDFAEETIYMNVDDVKQEFLKNRFEPTYIKRVLQDDLGLKLFEKDGKQQVIRYAFPKWDIAPGQHESTRVSVKKIGRPYVFHRSAFITDEMMKQYELDAEMVQQSDTGGIVKPSPVTQEEELPANWPDGNGVQKALDM